MIRQDDHFDGDRPKTLERYPNLGNVPDDLIELVASEFIVKAECQHCGHEAFYVDSDSLTQPECKGPNCGEQILLN